MKYELINYPCAQILYLLFYIVSQNECDLNMNIISDFINVVFEINRGILFVFPQKCKEDHDKNRPINQCQYDDPEQAVQEPLAINNVNNEQNNQREDNVQNAIIAVQNQQIYVDDHLE
ncbi:Hypothetical_protein [Hexamita inflata]|uniref:Hypothetical_protein n=1 Tax=Hexamita inflata TaxID=28002 RepID=A0AA86TL60_9EUKA|nr:Hypothetical protein HINF_LOCUS8385 [Hexamita inflata]